MPKISRAKKQKLFDRQRGKCVGCQQTLSINLLTIDHKVPIARGGGDEISNLQLLCTKCNRQKGSKTQKEFFDLREGKGA